MYCLDFFVHISNIQLFLLFHYLYFEERYFSLVTIQFICVINIDNFDTCKNFVFSLLFF
jgi:hypothetical protein